MTVESKLAQKLYDNAELVKVGTTNAEPESEGEAEGEGEA